MTTYTDLYSSRNLLFRQFFPTPGVYALEAVPGAGIVRASCVGAGGVYDNAGSPVTKLFGGGAAFAKVKTTCTPGEDFSVQVGDPAHSVGAGDALGDSKLIRVTGTVTLLSADRGRGTTTPNKGLASNSVGDTKRDGNDSASLVGGASGSDTADAYSLGFGGRGARYMGVLTGLTRYPAAGPGGGGGLGMLVDELPTGVYWSYFAGSGLVCVEFFRTDPGY